MSYPTLGKKSWTTPRGSIDGPDSQQSMIHSSQLEGSQDIHSKVLAETEPNSLQSTDGQDKNMDSQDTNPQAVSLTSPTQMNHASLLNRSGFEKPEDLAIIDYQYRVKPFGKPNLTTTSRDKKTDLYFGSISTVGGLKQPELNQTTSTPRPPSPPPNLSQMGMNNILLHSRPTLAIPNRQDSFKAATVATASDLPLPASEPEFQSTPRGRGTSDAVDLTRADTRMDNSFETNGQSTSEGSADTMKEAGNQQVHGSSRHNDYHNKTHGVVDREYHQPKVDHRGVPIPRDATANVKQRQQLPAQNAMIDRNHDDIRQEILVNDHNATKRPCDNNIGPKAQKLPKGPQVPHAVVSSASSSTHITPKRANAARRSNTQTSRVQTGISIARGDLVFSGGVPSVSPPKLQTTRVAARTKAPRENVPQHRGSSRRPYSRESNISKPRVTTPCRRNEKLARQDRKMNHAFHTFGHSWNHIVSSNQEYRVMAEEEMAHLEETIAAYEEMIKECQFDVEAQRETASWLENENTKLREKLELRENRLVESSSKLDRLNEKCRYYKDCLNKATEEQQRLYLKSKETVKTALSQLRTEGQGSKEYVEQALKTSESVRLNMEKKVAATVSEARERAAELDKTIATLRLELQHREKELSNEKESNKKVQQELDDSRRFNSQTLQSLTTQNERILKTIQEQRNHAQDAEISACEQSEKMSSVIDVLEQVRTKVADPTAMIEQLKSIQEDAVRSLKAEIQKVASGHVMSDQDKQTWTVNIQSIKDLCEGITEHMETDQHNLQWQESYEQVANKLHQTELWWQDTHNELEETKTKFDEVVSTNTKFDAENEHLRHQVESLKEEVEKLQSEMEANRNLKLENEELHRTVDSLQEQTKKLQGEIHASHNSESSEIAALQKLLAKRDSDLEISHEKLEGAEERLNVQDELLKNNALSMRASHEQLEEVQQVLNTANQQRQQTISDAVRKETRRLQDMQRDTKARLDSAEKARIKLDQDLQQANEKVQRLSSGAVSNGQDIRKLTATMKESTRKVVQLMNELAATKRNQESMKGQLEQWNVDKAELARMGELLNTIEKHQAMTLEAETQMTKMIQLCEQHLKADQGDVRNDVPADGFSPSSNPIPATSSSDLPQIRDRHVVIKSPIEEDAVLAPSVSQERERRRQAVTVKPIMKMTRRASRELEAKKQAAEAQSHTDAAPAQQNQNNPVPSAHSSFNRPVRGGGTGESGCNTTLTSTSTSQKRPLPLPVEGNSRKLSAAGMKSNPSTAHEAYNKRRRITGPTQEHYIGQSGNRPPPTRSASQGFLNDTNAGEDLTKSHMTGPSSEGGRLHTSRQPGGLARQPSKFTRTYGSQPPHP